MEAITGDAALLFLAGQSNAYAHDQFLQPEERIRTPLRNVFMLHRTENLTPMPDAVHWSGYTTCGSNLGTPQDHTACMGYYIARAWQAAIDRGDPLPDLYIVQIAVGAQGILKGMWSPDSATDAVTGLFDPLPGFRLYSYTKRVLTLALEDLRRRYRDPKILGWHWLGCEDDGDLESDEAETDAAYDQFFDGMYEVLGENVPVWFYKIVSFHRGIVMEHYTAEHICAVNHALRRQCGRRPGSVWVEPDKFPLWDRTQMDYGLFAQDYVHYTARTQRFMAEQFLRGLQIRTESFRVSET